jgi:hypothetical protein
LRRESLPGKDTLAAGEIKQGATEHPEDQYENSLITRRLNNSFVVCCGNLFSAGIYFGIHWGF